MSSYKAYSLGSTVALLVVHALAFALELLLLFYSTLGDAPLRTSFKWSTSRFIPQIRYLLIPTLGGVLPILFVAITYSAQRSAQPAIDETCDFKIDGDISGDGVRASIWVQEAVLTSIMICGSFHPFGLGAKEIGGGLIITQVSLIIALLVQMGRKSLTSVDAIIGAIILDGQNNALSIQFAAKETLAARWQVGVTIMAQALGLLVIPIVVTKFKYGSFSPEECGCFSVYWWGWLDDCSSLWTVKSSSFWVYYAFRITSFSQCCFHTIYNTTIFDKAEQAYREKTSHNTLENTTYPCPTYPSSVLEKKTLITYNDCPATVTLMYTVHAVFTFTSMATAEMTIRRYSLQPSSQVYSVGQIIAIVVSGSTVIRALYLFASMFLKDAEQWRTWSKRNQIDTGQTEQRPSRNDDPEERERTTGSDVEDDKHTVSSASNNPTTVSREDTPLPHGSDLFNPELRQAQDNSTPTHTQIAQIPQTSLARRYREPSKWGFIWPFTLEPVKAMYFPQTPLSLHDPLVTSVTQRQSNSLAGTSPVQQTLPQSDEQKPPIAPVVPSLPHLAPTPPQNASSDDVDLPERLPERLESTELKIPASTPEEPEQPEPPKAQPVVTQDLESPEAEHDVMESSPPWKSGKADSKKIVGGVDEQSASTGKPGTRVLPKSRNAVDLSAIKAELPFSMFKEQLREGKDVSGAPNKYYNAALLEATSDRDIVVMRTLLETCKDESDPNCEDLHRRTPLFLAADLGFDKGVELLLDTSNIDVNGSAGPVSPLSMALHRNHSSTVKLLLQTGQIDLDRAFYREDMTPLFYSAQKGDVALVELILKQYKVDVESTNTLGRTALSFAAEHGHADVVRQLLETYKADANSTSQLERTPLSYAAQNGHIEAVKLLLDTGKVNDEFEGKMGRTPLYWVARQGHLAVVEALLERDNIDVNVGDPLGQTPLFLAADRGHVAVVEALLKRDDINVSVRDYLGQIPLFLAAKRGHVAVVEAFLMRDDIDVNVRDHFDQTPLFLAAERGHVAVVEALLKRDDIDVNIKNKDGETPLLLAAASKQKHIVEILLKDKKVDINMPDSRGRTPLSCAEERGAEDIVTLLKSYDKPSK